MARGHGIIHTAGLHRESIASGGSAVLQSLPLEPSHQVSANLDRDLGRKQNGGANPNRAARGRALLEPMGGGGDHGDYPRTIGRCHQRDLQCGPISQHAGARQAILRLARIATPSPEQKSADRKHDEDVHNKDAPTPSTTSAVESRLYCLTVAVHGSGSHTV
jgi:hypothetical protein